jgi:transposase
MRGKTYRVYLTADEKKRLGDMISGGLDPARQLRRARILLLLNEGENQEERPVKIPEQKEIARQCQCNTGLVYTVSRQFVKEGLEQVLQRKKREKPPVPPKATGEVAAKLIALSRGDPPAGHSRWTLRLLEKQSREELGIELSDTTIRMVLKKYSKTPIQ